MPWGTALARSESETDIHAKAAAYGIASETVDGQDVRWRSRPRPGGAIASIRETGRPYFLECRTYPFPRPFDV